MVRDIKYKLEILDNACQNNLDCPEIMLFDSNLPITGSQLISYGKMFTRLRNVLHNGVWHYYRFPDTCFPYWAQRCVRLLLPRLRITDYY